VTFHVLTYFENMNHVVQCVIYQNFVYLKLAIFKMNVKEEQRICIKFCVKNGISATKTLEMLSNAFVDIMISRTTILEWQTFQGRQELH